MSSHWMGLNITPSIIDVLLGLNDLDEVALSFLPSEGLIQLI